MPRIAAEIEAVTSPSWISLMRAPAARISSIRSWWRGRSSTIVVMSFDVAAEALGDRARCCRRSAAPGRCGPSRAGRRPSAACTCPGASAATRAERPRSSTSRRSRRARRRRGPRAGRRRGRTTRRRCRSSTPISSCSAPPAPMTMAPSIGSSARPASIAPSAASSAASWSSRPSQRAPASAAHSVARANSAHGQRSRALVAHVAACAIRSARSSTSSMTAPTPSSTRLVLDHGHVAPPRALDDVVLDHPDLGQRRDVPVDRPDAVRAEIAVPEMVSSGSPRRGSRARTGSRELLRAGRRTSPGRGGCPRAPSTSPRRARAAALPRRRPGRFASGRGSRAARRRPTPPPRPCSARAPPRSSSSGSRA